MSTSIYINCPGKQKESVPVAGASAAAEFWLPLVHDLNLDLLDVAFTGGLEITEEYYSEMVEQVNIILSRFKAMSVSTPGIEDVASRCSQLLDILKTYTPDTGCRLYLG